MIKFNLNKFTNNWKVVTFSIMGATTFWLFRALNEQHSALISYPIEFVFNRDSTVVMNPLPTVIKIDVSSGGWNLFRRTLIFGVDPLKVELDNPSEVNFLTQSFLSPIVEDQLEGLKINYIVTDTLFLNIERKIKKRMRLKVDSLNLSLEKDYQLISSIDIRPDHMMLIGPDSIINSFETDFDITPDDNEIDEDFDSRVEVPIVFKDLIQSEPNEVNVSFEVDKFKNVNIEVPIALQNFPTNIPRSRHSFIFFNTPIFRTTKFMRHSICSNRSFNRYFTKYCRGSNIPPIILYRWTFFMCASFDIISPIWR